MTEGMEMLLNGKPFNCDCGSAFFTHVMHEDSFECVVCEARYRREDGGHIAGTGKPKG